MVKKAKQLRQLTKRKFLCSVVDSLTESVTVSMTVCRNPAYLQPISCEQGTPGGWVRLVWRRQFSAPAGSQSCR
jgi:hypothetical protein